MLMLINIIMVFMIYLNHPWGRKVCKNIIFFKNMQF